MESRVQVLHAAATRAAASTCLQEDDARRSLTSWLLARWHGHSPPPTASEVLLLRSSELQQCGEAVQTYFVGMTDGQHLSREWLHRATLARELPPAAERVACIATAEAEWQVFVDHFADWRGRRNRGTI